MKENIHLAIEAALEAGNAIMQIYNSDKIGITTKEDMSPLTIADSEAHKIISNYLSNTPYPILSEEGEGTDYKVRKKWDTFWVVDPLDGTKEYINKNGEFTVNIALVKHGVPVEGVVYAPDKKLLYFTDENESYKISDITTWTEFQHLNKEKLQRASISNELIIVASKSHMSKETEDKIESIKYKHPEYSIRTISMGSSLKICLVAEGKANFYPRYAPTMEWDTAAGHAICRKANVPVKKYNSKTELVYNKENLTNPWFEVGSWE